MQLTPFDANTWPRRDIYEFFSTLRNPFYMVTFRQDVTALRKYTRRNSLSFYYAMVYLCTRAINEVPAFRSRSTTASSTGCTSASLQTGSMPPSARSKTKDNTIRVKSLEWRV